MESTQISAQLVDGTLVYARDNDKKRVIDLVLSDDCNNRNITPICLIANSGIGKTTLVQLIYANRRICNVFDMRAFIQMTEGSDMKSLMKQIIESLTCVPCNITEPSMVERIVMDELMNKKVLIILDGAENENREFWMKVLTLLSAAGKGSVVLLTTNRQEVAIEINAVHYYKLDCLSDEICWLIFQQKAFQGQSVIHPTFAKVGKELIATCTNNTLGVNLLGGFLCHSTTEEQWMKLWISLSKSVNSWNRDSMGGTVLIIRECYERLPTYLQRCVDYCSLFPKNLVFLRNQVVHLWLAQGFIEPMIGRELEDTGFEYFDELYNRSFFQCSPLYDAKMPSFQMHELIHAFLQEKSQDIFFRYENNLRTIPHSIHHLSLTSSGYHTVQIDCLVAQARNLQSFLVIDRLMPQLYHPYLASLNLAGLNDLILNSKNLRALDLSNTGIKELPNSISSLSMLQYFSLSNTNIKSIPSQIGDLISLRYFEARNCYHLVDLPESIDFLMELRHLDVSKKAGFVGMPVGIGKLTNLRSLVTFNVGSDELHSGIKELKNLVYLRGCLVISGLENVKSALDAKQAQLKDKACIESLTLQWTNNMEYSENNIDAELHEKVLENLQPSANLTELIVRSYPGRKFSIWMGNPSYSRLISIIIDGCPNCSQLPALGALPSLKHLSVQKLDGIENMELFKFPSLESMKIWEIYNLEELFITEKGALPRLHSLSISKCPLLRSIPCFTSLLELSIHYCSQLPQISDLASLQCLNIEGFPKIKHLILPQGLSGLKKLEISFCNELSSLDNLSKLTSIEELNIYQCPKLHTCDWRPNYLVRDEESRNYRQEDTKGGHVYRGDKTRTDPGNPLTPIQTQTQSDPRNPLEQIQTHIRPNLTISESQTDLILTNPIRPNLKSSSIQSKPNQSEIQKTSIRKLTQSSPTLPVPNSTQSLPEGQTSLIQSDLNLTRLPPLHVYTEENTMANASIIGALIVLESALTNELATLATSRAPEFLSVLSVLDTSMNNIFSELRVMQAFIEQTELTAHRNKVVLVWLGEVQKVANQVKETVDEFVNSVDNEQYGGIWLYVQRIFKDRKSLVNLRRVASKLQAIESKLEHLAELKDRWVPTSNVGLVMNSNRSNEYAQHLAVSAHFIDEKNIVGIEENREVLSRWLNSGETHLCVISVWGMGGVGKTTLVANVFKRERKNFDCRAWVSLSESYTTENILRNIISEIFRDNHSLPIDTSNMNVRCLKEYLLGVLKDMKYLIVLDDIWNPKSVVDISDILIDNHKNSRIVITSRMADVANLAPESNRLELKPLSIKESWDLFCRNAFPLEKNHKCPSPLEQWAREIVLKCDGLPLALVSLGSALSLLDKTESEWKRVYDQLSWELENNPTLDSLKNILILSFKYLPIYLKQCLLYCCLFPEDSLLARKKLVRLWIAEGFIEQKGRSTLEEVAEGYFNELIHRSMLQVVAKNSSDRAKRCRMHHTLRELAIRLCSNENFGLLHDDNKKVSFKDIIRRLSVVKQSEEINQNVNLSYLRTFMSVDPTIPSSSVFSLIFNKSRYLVVLNLEGLPIETIPDTIGNLFNLRYLGLRGTKVKLLPKSIDKLSNLQTLDLMRSKIQKLPDGIAELKRLCHLFAQVLLDPTYRTFQSLAGVTLPKGIFYLKELQTVQTLESNALTIRELGNLTQLRSFRILNVKENHSQELCKSLSNMSSLSYLSIFASNENIYLQLEDLKFLPQLQKLCLFGRLKEQMLQSPLFQIFVQGIQMLRLGWSQLSADPLPSLSHLENLAWLTLQKAYEGNKLHFKAGWFPKLKNLVLRQMPNLVQVEMERGTMVSLDTIHLLELEQLDDIPEGIKHLTNLRWMVCKYMPASFADLPSGIHQLHHFRCQVL